MHCKNIMLSKHYDFHALQVYYKCTTYQVYYPESTQSADKKSADISANPQILSKFAEILDLKIASEGLAPERW